MGRTKGFWSCKLLVRTPACSKVLHFVCLVSREKWFRSRRSLVRSQVQAITCTFYMALWVARNVSEITGHGFEPWYGLNFSNCMPECIPKIYLFSMKFWIEDPRFFHDTPLQSLMNRQVASLNFSISFIFRYFIPKCNSQTSKCSPSYEYFEPFSDCSEFFGLLIVSNKRFIFHPQLILQALQLPVSIFSCLELLTSRWFADESKTYRSIGLFFASITLWHHLCHWKFSAS